MSSHPNKVLSLVPGPTQVPPSISRLYSTSDYLSPDLESSFFEQYGRVQSLLAGYLKTTQSSIVIMSGEGMLALWAALKSTIKPNDKVLSIATGIFGYGIADMASGIGAQVKTLGCDLDRVFSDTQLLQTELDHFSPKLVTSVHCETPSGTINPIHKIGSIVKRTDALLYVDFVASAGGVPVEVDAWGIDLGLLGNQKCLSLPPDLSILTVSPKAWKVIESVGYIGYDAILPWKNAVQNRYFPYTHNWRAIAALEASLLGIFEEGLEKVFQRHKDVSAYCRKRLQEMGVPLFPKCNEEAFAATVTAACVPSGWSWEELNGKLRERGVILGGNYGALKGKVFRIGHMGTQADLKLVREALDALQEILNEGNKQRGPKAKM